MPLSRQFRLLVAHCAAYQASTSIAGGFIGAYLLKLGFSLPAALTIYAAVLAMRFGMRFAVLSLVGRIGLKAALVLGVSVGAAQFLPLLHALSPVWLFGWVLTVSLSEALYWPALHATAAVTGQSATRGHEIATRQAVCAVVAVAGPLLGGWILTRFGPTAGFTLAGTLFLVSAVPLLMIPEIAAGPVPTLKDSLRGIDRLGMAAFAADGWMSSGLQLAWPMVLFTMLGSHYQAFGWSSAGAALAGAAAGIVCGAGIDRGQRSGFLGTVSLALAAVFILRAAASWSSPLTVNLANAAGAAVTGLYTPVIMSVLYDRAKLSHAAYRFHLAAEAGWDIGAVGGCLAAAAVAWSSANISLAMLPAIFGIAQMHACVRSHTGQARAPLGLVASAVR